MDSIVEKINNASLKFLTPLPAEEMYKTIVEEARKLSAAEHGSIILVEHGRFERVYASVEFLKNIKVRNNGFTYKTFKENKPTVLEIEALPDFHPGFIEHGVKSVIHIPLSYKNESIGVLTLHSSESKHFSEKELNILRLYGSLASLAIKKTQLYEEQTKSLEIRDLFISLASHELRTPLTSINGYIQLLHSKLGKKETSEGKWIRELNDESQRLTNLVKELLEINRIKQGQFQFSFIETNFVQIVEKTINRLRLTNPERKIILTNTVVDDEDMIIGDPEKLLQMITALLENALKFSPSQFIIEVIVHSTKKQIILTIKDKGVGIKHDDLRHIMEGFYKGSQQDKEGIGVGLVLARHIIQSHHGDLKMMSQPKKGTEVRIKLPKIR